MRCGSVFVSGVGGGASALNDDDSRRALLRTSSTAYNKNMVVTHESAPPKSKPKTGPSGANVPGKEKRLRSKEGCLTCRIRGKKCDQGKASEETVAGNPPGCAACRRLRIECLGYARNRPEWLKVRPPRSALVRADRMCRAPK